MAKEEEEKQENDTRLEIRSLLSVPSERRTAVQRSRLRALLQLWVEASSSSKRKRKKKRKKKLPRSGRTRRRHRQWRVRHAGFGGSFAPRDVFPVADDWPLLLDNTAGMDQKDSFFRRGYGSGICKAGFVGFSRPAVFPSVLVRP